MTQDKRRPVASLTLAVWQALGSTWMTLDGVRELVDLEPEHLREILFKGSRAGCFEVKEHQVVLQYRRGAVKPRANARPQVIPEKLVERVERLVEAGETIANAVRMAQARELTKFSRTSFYYRLAQRRRGRRG